MEKHAHTQAIERIGKERVRTHFGLSKQGIYNWTVGGIPPRYHNSVRLLASLHSVVVPELNEEPA